MWRAFMSLQSTSRFFEEGVKRNWGSNHLVQRSASKNNEQGVLLVSGQKSALFTHAKRCPYYKYSERKKPKKREKGTRVMCMPDLCPLICAHPSMAVWQRGAASSDFLYRLVSVR
jgi:hypothetical protein